jgi:hypothetical protein
VVRTGTMRRCRIRTLVGLGLGLACLSATGCGSPLKMGAMWVGKTVLKESVKAIRKAHDARHAKDDETDPDATAPQPPSAAEPSQRPGRH